MILSSCPHCRRAVSERARVCASCGGVITSEAKANMAAGVPDPIGHKGPNLGVHLLVASGLFWGGILLTALATPSVTSSSEPQSSTVLFMPLITGTMIAAGILWYVVTKLCLRYKG